MAPRNPKPLSAGTKEKPHSHPADGNGEVIRALSNGKTHPVAPMALPHNDGSGARPLTNHRGESYRRVEVQAQHDMLLDQIGRLETEHFGLTRGFSTVSHTGNIEDDETGDESYRRFVAERLPHVEAELDRLYGEHDEAIRLGLLDG